MNIPDIYQLNAKELIDLHNWLARMTGYPERDDLGQRQEAMRTVRVMIHTAIQMMNDPEWGEDG